MTSHEHNHSQAGMFLVIGDPISHSLSPRMHTAAYQAAGLPFTMQAARVTREALPDFIRGAKSIGINGLAVTMPHKVTLLKLLDQIDPNALRIGAVNTVVNRDGVLIGYNTDWLGILAPLERLTSLKAKSIAMVGAGGAAAAAVFGCMEGGASVTIFNRTVENAQAIAERLGCEVGDLRDVERIAACDIIINTTSVGMGDATGASPLPASALRSHHIIFETIYAPHTTALVRDALVVGAKVVRGLDMFLEQGVAQFELHTSVKAPRREMEQILLHSKT